MKLQPPDAPKPPRTARAPKAAPAPNEPGFAAWCKTLSAAAALAYGCASVPIKAEPFECPPGAVQAMEKLGWIGVGKEAHTITIQLDERGPDRGAWTYTLGAPVTGVVPDSVIDEMAPRGTLFYGRVYRTDALRGAPYGELRVIYDHVEFPGKRKYPVCVVSGPVAIMELKGDKATAPIWLTGDPVTSWAPPRE